MLSGKLDSKIASEVVTIVDDPLIPWEFGSAPFDSEGVASYKKIVVEDGVFKTFLHNTKTARKDSVAPTGNGFKTNFDSAVSIAGTNFFVKPADKSLEALMAELGNGLMITDFAGLHSGVNPVSGEFSLQAEGFAIKDGKKDRPVEQITVSGSFFDMLNSITAVGSDLKFGTPGPAGNIGSPSLLIRDLDIAGS